MLALQSSISNIGLSACYIYIYICNVLCICIVYMYYVYAHVYNINKQATPTTNNNTCLGGTGGSAKLKSSKGDNTLRDGRKGDPLHECCGNKMFLSYLLNSNVREPLRHAEPQARQSSFGNATSTPRNAFGTPLGPAETSITNWRGWTKSRAQTN